MTVNKLLFMEMLCLLRLQKDWIDAVPDDVQLPAMPGFDGDWADGVLTKASEAAKATQ